jgi:4-carboxymuconolactone decarboxylase
MGSVTIATALFSVPSPAMIACAWAQQPAKLPEVAILSPRALTAQTCAANIQASALTCFKAAVRKLGFVDVKSCFESNAATVILFGALHGSPHRWAMSSWESTHMNRRHLCSLLAALAATVVIDAMGADPPMTAKEPRFPQLTVEQLNEQQKHLGEQILKVSSVGLGGPYNPLLRSPVLGQRMFDLLYYLRWNTSVPLRLNEFAILIIGRQWRSQVEWFAHAPLAIKAGLSPEIVTELKANKRPANMKPDEAVVYDFVTELSAKHQVSDETFKRAKELLGEQQVVDLTAVAGTYVTIAMVLAMAEEGVPPGKDLPFKVGEP